MPEFDYNNVKVVFVLGGPGAGKGTQCMKLREKYPFVHLSAGDLLREEQNREGSEFGEEIKTCIKEGSIVRMEVTIALLQKAMLDAIQKRSESGIWEEGRGGFLIDGFPRKMDQAEKFEEDVCVASLVLFYDTTEEVMLERLLERGKTSGRSDDNKESIVKRFRTYNCETRPVIEHFERQKPVMNCFDSKVAKISADQTVEEVFTETCQYIEKLSAQFTNTRSGEISGKSTSGSIAS